MPSLNKFRGTDSDVTNDTRALLDAEEEEEHVDLEASTSGEFLSPSTKNETDRELTASPSQAGPVGSHTGDTKQTVGTDGDKNEGGNGVGETEEEAEKESVSYFRLYRYASCKEKVIVIVGLIVACITGVVPALANFSFGKFTKTMVAYASNSSRQCPPPPSNETSPFMKEVEIFALYQSSLGLLEFLLGYIFVMCLNHVAEKQVFKIRKEYFRKLLQQDISWFDKNAKRDFSSRMVDDMIKIQDSMSEKMGMLVSGAFNCVFLTGLAFLLGWKLTLALMAFIPVLGIISAFDGKIQTSMTTLEQDAYAGAGAIAEESLTNIRTVHAFNGQDKEIQRYDVEIQKAKRVSYKKHVFRGLGNGIVWFVSLANFAYAFWYGSVLAVNSRETGDGIYGPDNILVILFSVLMAGFYFGSSSEYMDAIGGGRGAAASIFPVLDRESEINSLSSDGVIPETPPRGDIEFKDVSFSYPTRPTVKVLNKLSIRVRPGQTVALVGASGCGKSTCCQLLQRFYDPAEGEISLDGVDISTLNIKWLRSQLGVVGQEPVLFNATIAENISFGRKGVSRDEIEAAAKQSYAHNFIMQLPQGYDTKVGERGASLSGGQKQRVAIARALVRNPAVLLLDEATSALDFQSESIVQAALERASQGRSTIIIAHRLSTIKSADVIYVVEKGAVVETGTHAELMRLKGKYYNLVLTQENTESPLEDAPEDVESEFCGEETVRVEEYMSSDRGTGKITSRTRLISQTSYEDVPKMEEVKEEDEKNVAKNVSLFRLWRTNSKEWPFITIVVLCSIVKGLQLPTYAAIFGDYIQSFTLKDDREVVYLGQYYCFVYLGIAGIMGVCGFLQLMLVGISGERFTYRIRKMLFSSLMEQDISFYDDSKNTVGKLTARLSTDASSIRGATGSRVTGILQASSIVIGSAAMSFYYLPNMAYVVVLFVPVMLYLSIIEGKVMGTDNVVERDSVEGACNVAVEALSNIRTVAGLCAEEQFMQAYEEALAASHKVNLKRAHVRGLVYGVTNGGPMLCYCLSLWYGGYLVEHACASIGNVFKVAEALIYCTTSGGAAIAYAADYEKGKLAAARIFELLDFRPIISRFSINSRLGTVKGQMDFENVNFNYRNRPSVKVLRNLSLSVKAGESVAVVGPSGSGKSTCAALIFRFYDPVSGSVKFDGFDLTGLDLDFFRQQLALVSQEPVLFDCSIRENIAYGDTSREIGMDEIIEAAKMTNMHSFITSLPAGYETRVGMLGNQMSGGQKQRIAIARAIIRQPKLLVLDEATSALDSESETLVQAALDSAKSGRTSITIAHRLSSIMNCDKIFVMRNGRLVESGTHQELVRAGGMYQTMWDAQSSQREP